MKYELTAPIYILFAELANFEVDTDQKLDRFLKENIEPAKGISKKYILDTLEQAFLDGETLNVKLVRKEVLIRNCLDWIKRNREENTIDAEITAFKPEVNDKRKNSKPKFSHTYIALKCFYKGIEITKNNADRIAKIYGYVAPNSGKKLKDQYDNHRTVQSRTNHPGAKRFINMINDLESIIKDLPEKKWKQGNPIEELDELRKKGKQF